MKHILLAITVLGLGWVSLVANVIAAERNSATAVVYNEQARPTKVRAYHKRRVRVRGYLARRGGYSYDPSDVVNTYGLSRSHFGSNNSYRDPWVDRQTPSGPFDHDFFFDSGVAPRGGNAPYLH